MRVLILCYIALLSVTCAYSEITPSIQQAYSKADLTGVKSINELAIKSQKITVSPKEQLQLLLLWVADNMQADSARFFSNNTSNIQTAVAFKSRKGLCEDYANIFHDYCKALNIPVLNVEGYVKEFGFKSGSVLKEANHIWNIALIENEWQLFDLFWATSILEINGNGVKSLHKRLKQDYVFANPDKFIDTHLPCDPAFQLLNNPFSLEAFSALEVGISGTMDKLPHIAFRDSIQKLYKMPQQDRAISIAEHAYAFNKNNYQLLITEYYNYGVSIVNSNAASLKNMAKAKQSFQKVIELATASKDDKNKDLIASCNSAINVLSNRIKRAK